MATETITTRILRTQHKRIWEVIGYPQKMSVERYVQNAVDEKLLKDEQAKKKQR